MYSGYARLFVLLEFRIQFCLLVCCTYPSLSTVSKEKNLRRIHSLVGLVVKVSASRAANPGFDSRLRRDFSGSSHTSDLKHWHTHAWNYRVSAWTGWPSVSIL